MTGDFTARLLKVFVQSIEINVSRSLYSPAITCAVCTLQLSLIKNVFIVFFSEKLKMEQMYQSRPEVTEVGLVKLMFVFMTGENKDEMLLLWFLVIMK